MNDEIVIYKSEDDVVKLDVLFSDETVWLTIDHMANLFRKSRSTINEHILNVFAEGELEENTTKRKIGISDFSTKPTNQEWELTEDTNLHFLHIANSDKPVFSYCIHC